MCNLLLVSSSHDHNTCIDYATGQVQKLPVTIAVMCISMSKLSVEGKVIANWQLYAPTSENGYTFSCQNSTSIPFLVTNSTVPIAPFAANLHHNHHNDRPPLRLLVPTNTGRHEMITPSIINYTNQFSINNNVTARHPFLHTFSVIYRQLSSTYHQTIGGNQYHNS